MDYGSYRNEKWVGTNKDECEQNTRVSYDSKISDDPIYLYKLRSLLLKLLPILVVIGKKGSRSLW